MMTLKVYNAKHKVKISKSNFQIRISHNSNRKFQLPKFFSKNDWLAGSKNFGSWKLEVEFWKLEVKLWKLEVDFWTLGVGS